VVNLFLAFGLLLADLVFEVPANFDVLFAFEDFVFQVLLTGLFIPHQTLIDIVSLCLPYELFVTISPLNNVAHFIHDPLDLVVAILNLLFPFLLLHFFSLYLLLN
jgi:hypothetical protein